MSQNVRLIGLCGKRGVGKDTAAARIESALGHYERYECDVEVLSLAYPMKRILSDLGVDFNALYGSSAQRETRLPSGRTVREALQALGTDWGRKYLGEDVWVNALLQRCEPQVMSIVTDVRFDNEARAIRAAGGLLVRIVRPGLQRAASAVDSHASETGLDGLADTYFDAVWVNDEGEGAEYGQWAIRGARALGVVK